MIYTFMDFNIISVTMKNYEKVISGTMKKLYSGLTEYGWVG